MRTLTPYINEDQEWKDMIEPSVMESVREEDGKIYLGPVSTAAFPPVQGFSGTGSYLNRQESADFLRHGRSSGNVVRN